MCDIIAGALRAPQKNYADTLLTNADHTRRATAFFCSRPPYSSLRACVGVAALARVLRVEAENELRVEAAERRRSRSGGGGYPTEAQHGAVTGEEGHAALPATLGFGLLWEQQVGRELLDERVRES